MRKLILIGLVTFLGLFALNSTDISYADSKNEGEFTDVTKESYAYESIMYLWKEGIINGYGNGKYGLKDNVTRGQVSALIARYLELDTSKNLDDPYTDVNGDMFEKEILAVSSKGYMQGKGNNSFDPNGVLTRAEMAQVLTNVFDLEVKDELSFVDMPKNHWAKESVQALYSNGITIGVGGNRFNPSGYVTREQYAEFLYRGINLDPDYEAEPIPPEIEEEPKEEPSPTDHRALRTGKLYDIDTTSVVSDYYNKFSSINTGVATFKNAENLRSVMSESLAISNKIKAVKDDKNKRFVVTIPKYDTDNYSLSVNTEDGQFKEVGTYYAYYDKIEPSTGIGFSLSMAELNYGSFITYNMWGYIKDGEYFIEEGSKARYAVYGRY